MSNKRDIFVCDVQDDIIGQHKVNGNGKNMIFSEKNIQSWFACDKFKVMDFSFG